MDPELKVEVSYEDESGRRSKQPNPWFFFANALVPFFFGQFGPELIRNDIGQRAKSIDLVFSWSPTPNASMKGSSATKSQININIGLYIALLSLPTTMRFLQDMLLLEDGINVVRLRNIEAPPEAVDELIGLMKRWNDSAETGWRSMSWPSKIVFSDRRLLCPILLFVMAHEFAHYYWNIIFDKQLIAKMYSGAEARIRAFFSDEQYLRIRHLGDSAVPLRRALEKSVTMMASWKDEILADEWAFHACMQRFSPSYNGPRMAATVNEGRTPLEPVFRTAAEVYMFTTAAAEVVFGLGKYWELFSDRILRKAVSPDTHPSALWRQELFVHTRAASANMPIPDFLGENYGAGLLSRIVMDSVLEGFIEKMDKLAQYGRR